MLHNKNILLLVTGSIAIYKSLDLISLLKKLGANVFVVMSNEAMRFIQPLTFEALSGHKVLHSNSQIFLQDSPNHISYANLADIAIVAPASINIIAKLNYGIADNIIIETLLATKAPILVAPSANINMLSTPQTKKNLVSLQDMGITIIEPRVSLLACNIVAKGAMADINEIIFQIKRVFLKSEFWSDKEVVITGGGSIEDIDDIRHISNNSSGKQASNLALIFYYLGAKVILISSRFPILLPLGIKSIEVKSSKDYKNALNKEMTKDSILLMAAAISDYVPNKVSGKLKKENLGETWNLALKQNMDILKELKAKFKVGFKAESDEDSAINNAKKMLKTKGCDMVVLNVINDDNKIGGDNNEIFIINKCRVAPKLKGSKEELSLKIANAIEKQMKCDK